MNIDNNSDYESLAYESDEEIFRNAIDENLDVFKILTADQVVKCMDDLIENVSSVVKMPPTTTRAVLKHCKWVKDVLMDRLYVDDQEKIFAEINIANPFTNSSEAVGKTSDGECFVCYDALPDIKLMGLECGHRFCYLCWNSYLNSKIMEQGMDTIRCLQHNCNILLDHEKCLEILEDPRVQQVYKRLVTNSFVECNNFLTWCPNPNCENAIQVEYNLVQPITCSCGFNFCFNCKEDWHSPLKCDLLKKWLKTCNDDSETQNWLLVYSKECPKCQVQMEKNGGCNHMACRNRNCRHEFCWICMEPWKTHTKCNSNKVDKNDQKKIAESALQWYLDHYHRYINHKQSLRLEEKLATDIKVKVQELLSQKFNQINTNVLENGVLVLKRCRKTLMYTCSFAYFLHKNSNQTIIFENNQADLQHATENLSSCLERELKNESFTLNNPYLIPKLTHLCRYVEDRCRVLEEHVQEGYDKHQWIFRSDLL